MSETTFGWLHLSDLHVGMAGGLGATLWETFEPRLCADLDTQLHKLPSLDLVVFTGDLTQCGTPAEFDALNSRLARLWEVFNSRGYNPPLVVVPGNHDLQRPSPSDPEAIALANWWSDRTPLLRQQWFWGAEGSRLRSYLDGVFVGYLNWWQACPYVLKDTQTHLGLLPGDFAQTIEKNGFRLGLVGLNSAFLQLDDKNAEGSLALDPRQLAALVEEGDTFYRWRQAHDAALLLTHHPSSWLNVQALRQFHESIYAPDYFSAHLFGHVHGGATHTFALGATNPRRLLQSASLFGLEDYDLYKDDKRERHQRLHGYGIGVLIIDNEKGSAVLLQRRRKGSRSADGSVRLSADEGAVVHDESTGFTPPESLQLYSNSRRATIPGPRRRPKLPFEKLYQTLRGVSISEAPSPMTLLDAFTFAYDCGLGNRENVLRSGIVIPDGGKSLHAYTIGGRIARMPDYLGAASAALQQWQLLRLSKQEAWMTTEFAAEFYSWLTSRVTTTTTGDYQSGEHSHASLRPSSDTSPVALDDEEVLRVLIHWIESSMESVLFRSHSHSELEEELNIPGGASRRLTARAVAKTQRPVTLAACDVAMFLLVSKKA